MIPGDGDLPEAHTHCLLLVVHGSHKLAGLSGARPHRLCPAFQEQSSHGRLVSQAELTPVLGERRRGARQLALGCLCSPDAQTHNTTTDSQNG